MGTTLVTGATGFIGTHVVRALAKRGDELRLFTRRKSDLDLLDGIEFERAIGDVTDRRAVRRAMKGVERVFHIAGRTSLRPQHRDAVWNTNVRGSRIVLESAYEAEVERMVFTSSVAAVGVGERPKPTDEDQTFDIGHLGITYVNSKHEAEVEAVRFAARGLPLTIVNPSFVLGPDAPHGSSMDLVRRFIQRRIPAYVDGGLNVVDVRDVAEGHLLADAKGQVGRRYILSGRNFTLDRLFADLARISGVPAPRLKMPAGALEHAMRVGGRLPLPIPLPSSPDEIRSARLWWCYKNTRAKSELGFSTRKHEDTLEDAVNWQRARLAGGR